MQEKYEQLKGETDVQIHSAADDHFFFKACGGWSEKGALYGLGREVLPCLTDQPSPHAVAIALLDIFLPVSHPAPVSVADDASSATFYKGGAEEC